MTRYPDGELPPIPQDTDAERSLLATICMSPDHPEVPECLTLLNGGEAFRVPQHQAIYLAFRALVDNHQEVDPLALKAELETQHTLDRVGGFGDLCQLLNFEEVVHPVRLARRLHDLHERRRLEHAATELLANLRDTSRPLEELLQDMQEAARAPRPEALISFPDMADLLDTPPEPPSWVIEGLIPKGVPCIVASKGGLGKSFLFLQACVALATGKPFLDFPAQPPMSVLYLNLEDPRNTFKTRLQSVKRWYEEPSEWSDQDEANLRANMAAPVIHWRAANASSYLPVLVPYLETWMAEQERAQALPGMIVIDTLARVSEGDENKVEAMRPVLNACLRLCEAGYSPVLLHHVGKGQDGAKGKLKERPPLAERMNTEWVRGTSAIVDNFRAVIQLAAIREDEAEGAGLDPEHASRGGYMVMGATKANGGQKADWRLLEQDEQGRWFLPRGWMEALARIRGKRALANLTKQLLLLTDIYQATRWGGSVDVKALCEKHAPADSKDKDGWFRSNVRRLRNSDFLEKKSYRLTVTGLQAIKRVTSVEDEDE